MEAKKTPISITSVREQVINLFSGSVPERGYSCEEIASLSNFDSLGEFCTRAVIIHYVLADLKLQGLLFEEDSRWHPTNHDTGLTSEQIAAAYIRRLLLGNQHYLKEGI